MNLYIRGKHCESCGDLICNTGRVSYRSRRCKSCRLLEGRHYKFHVNHLLDKGIKMFEEIDKASEEFVAPLVDLLIGDDTNDNNEHERPD